MHTKLSPRPVVSRVAVEVQFAGSQSQLPEAFGITTWAETVIQHMGDDPDAVDVCVRIVDEAESRELNKNYRHKDKPTNVLSFTAELPPGLEAEMKAEMTAEINGGQKLLGDIVICDPVVRREAQAQEKSLHDHYAHMVVHGMLHLYGFDHMNQAEADEMEGTEREILERFGIADPYLAH